MDVAYELNRIFCGNQTAHGEFIIDSQKGLKLTGKAKTVKGAVNEDLWRKHLEGTKGIGIVPIREDSTCSWGAVDIDEYEGIDLEDLSFKITAPLVLCRSKSGGLHVYLFTSIPVPAALMRKKLALVARSIGHPNDELFPKQDKLNEGDSGNWINMPYFGGDATTRYAIKGGMALGTEDFINLVAENSLNIQQMVAYQPEIITDEVGAEFSDAPPCLQTLVKVGFPTGSRNSALFSMGVFARMKFTSGWEDKVFEYNNRFMGPGSYSEVSGIIRSLNKKSYIYKCKDQPLLSVCDKEACASCQYGVKLSNDDEKSKRPNILDEVERPVKCYAPTTESKDDPYWVFTINGTSIDVTVDMVRSQAIFSREYLRQYHRVILPIKDAKWVKEINEILSTAEVFQLAPDAGPEGQMWIHLEEFCTGKSKARVKEEMLLGKPWHDANRTYFRSNDFMKYLDQQRYRSMKDTEIFRAIKTRGAKHHHMSLKGKHVTCWSIDSFDVQQEGFDSVEIPDDTEY